MSDNTRRGRCHGSQHVFVNHSLICLCGAVRDEPPPSVSPDSAPAREASEDVEGPPNYLHRYLRRECGFNFKQADVFVSMLGDLAAMRARCASLEHEIREARKETAHFRRYSRHDDDCGSYVHQGYTTEPARLRCTCGFSASSHTAGQP